MWTVVPFERPRTARPTPPATRRSLMTRRRTAFLVLALATASLAAPSSAPAQAPPIRIGEINSFSGIGAPFTGPYQAGGGDGGRGGQRQGRDQRAKSRGDLPRRQGPARGGGEARPGAGGVREGRPHRGHLPLQRRSCRLRLGQAEQDHVRGRRAPDRGHHVVEGTRPRRARCGPIPTSRAACWPEKAGQDEVRRSGRRSGPTTSTASGRGRPSATG